MNKYKTEIWGRSFNLSVLFDCYKGETVTKKQEEAFSRFVDKAGLIDNALPSVKRYCIEDENTRGISQIDNIFKYVMPKAIFVKRTKLMRVVALMCDYKYDREHGIALLFENEKFKEIVNQCAL